MKVLQVHNHYLLPGGEDEVVRQERELLSGNGHSVTLLSVKNTDFHSLKNKVQVAWRLADSPMGFEKTRAAISQHSPDIVHVHNFFPLLSPSVFRACNEAGIPVIMTLHNYRLLCPSGSLFIDGKIDETSINYSPYAVVHKRAYKRSVLGTIAVARMISKHNKLKTWDTRVTQFIALTQFAKSVFVRAGFRSELIKVKPNFLSDPLSKRPAIPDLRKGALYVGRLSAEKGISVLLEAWRNVPEQLYIAGAGDARWAEDNDNPNVHFLGPVTRDQVTRLMLKSQFLVFPSLWYEGFPMVILEAFAHGLPVIASSLGSMKEIVSQNRTGVTYAAGDADALRAVVSGLSEKELRYMSKEARNEYLSRYTPARNLRLLEAIYCDAMRRLPPNRFRK